MLEQLDALKAEALAALDSANDETAIEAARVTTSARKAA